MTSRKSSPSSSAQLDIDNFPCMDFLAFQESVQRMRLLDDKIIYELNAALPTSSFAKDIDANRECQRLRQLLNESHQKRHCLIDKCLLESQQTVNNLRSRRDSNPDNVDDLTKQLRSAQNTLRLLQSETIVEEIVNNRTNKAYDERCRPRIF